MERERERDGVWKRGPADCSTLCDWLVHSCNVLCSCLPVELWWQHPMRTLPIPRWELYLLDLLLSRCIPATCGPRIHTQKRRQLNQVSNVVSILFFILYRERVVQTLALLLLVRSLALVLLVIHVCFASVFFFFFFGFHFYLCFFFWRFFFCLIL
jgi:hypothetical protein